MIEDIVDKINENTTYFLFKESTDYLLGCGGKKSTITNSNISMYLRNTIYETKKERLYGNIKAIMLLQEMKKEVKVQKVEITKKERFLRKPMLIEKVRVEVMKMPTKLEELYGEPGKAYTLSISTRSNNGVENPEIYFVMIGKQEELEEIAKSMINVYKPCLEELFPIDKFPEANEMVNSLKLEDLIYVEK